MGVLSLQWKTRPGAGIRAYICTPTLSLIPRSIRTMSIRVQLERMIDLQQFFPGDRVMYFEPLANETNGTGRGINPLDNPNGSTGVVVRVVGDHCGVKFDENNVMASINGKYLPCSQRFLLLIGNDQINKTIIEQELADILLSDKHCGKA